MIFNVALKKCVLNVHLREMSNSVGLHISLGHLSVLYFVLYTKLQPIGFTSSASISYSIAAHQFASFTAFAYLSLTHFCHLCHVRIMMLQVLIISVSNYGVLLVGRLS